MAGWLFVLQGVLFAIVAIVHTGWMFIAAVGPTGICAVWIIVYTYLVYRRDPNRTSPAGTLPARLVRIVTTEVCMRLDVLGLAIRMIGIAAAVMGGRTVDTTDRLTVQSRRISLRMARPAEGWCQVALQNK